MNREVSKSNEDWELIDARLAEVRLQGYERLKAKAQLERAEAFADALVWLSGAVKRAVKQLFDRPYHRPNASIR